ncbi:metal ABC transporter solute-binding protein, Zn/Mn family [Leptolyngbya sp. PCC 6406]|uniref:metal ABC transporter solute-binding protein, Zn/Mn family n=1 Tax=Leptolyngbya sp. PCC 6406 TaxID=1173264 RepID=UPI0012DD261F|nr:zinc ABC transporter substrate-binding protein [Leptolyngbya sp. PCC 6406]
MKRNIAIKPSLFLRPLPNFAITAPGSKQVRRQSNIPKTALAAIVTDWSIGAIAQNLGILGVATLTLSGCWQQSMAPDESGTDAPQVVVTSTILTDLVATVGGDNIAVTGLLDPGDDPHLYEPVPQDTVALERADLIFYNGYNLEPALIRLIEGAGVQAEKVALGEEIQPLTFEEEGQRQPDPHVWGNVENAIAMVDTIRVTLGQKFPADAATFDRNAAALTAELQTLHGWIGDQVDTIPANQRTLVTTHDAFQYYAQAYGLTVLGTLIGISTEEQPSAQTVRLLVDAIRQAQVPAIFAETTINPALITTVATEAGVRLAEPALYADALGAPGSGADTYMTMMATNTETIVTALGGAVIPYAQ